MKDWMSYTVQVSVSKDRLIRFWRFLWKMILRKMNQMPLPSLPIGIRMTMITKIKMSLKSDKYSSDNLLCSPKSFLSRNLLWRKRQIKRQSLSMISQQLPYLTFIKSLPESLSLSTYRIPPLLIVKGISCKTRWSSMILTSWSLKLKVKANSKTIKAKMVWPVLISAMHTKARNRNQWQVHRTKINHDEEWYLYSNFRNLAWNLVVVF